MEKIKGIKLIVILALVSILLSIIMVGIFNRDNIMGILSNRMQKENESEDQTLEFISYQIYDNKDKEHVKIIVTINSENGIEYIKRSDGTIVQGNGKNKVGLDYSVAVNVEEQVIVKEIGKEERTEKILLTGAGNEEAPIMIMNAEQLLNLQENTDKLFKSDVLRKEIYYRVEANIDLSDIEWTEIGTTTKPFEGILDGNSDNYTISNLTYSSEENTNLGLFGYITGTLKNIKLDNCKVTGKDNVGILVGNNAGAVNNIKVINSTVNGINNIGLIVGYNTGKIDNNIVQGEVTATGNNVGGTVGYTINNSISNNTADVIVSGNENIGGIIGNSTNGSSLIFDNNKCNGSITGNKSVGGIIGYFNCNATISNSYSTANINAKEDNAGGLIGCHYSNSSIYQCYSTGKIKTATNNVGGLIGITYYSNVTMYNNFSLCDVSGEDYCGGLIGKTEGSGLQLYNNYTCGNIERKKGNIGAFAGIPRLDGWQCSNK